MEGQGTYVFDGHKYAGAFTEDQPLGDGRFQFNHGAEQEGRFVVKSSEDDAPTKAKWVGGAVQNADNEEGAENN
jgi:hypothetical protein